MLIIAAIDIRGGRCVRLTQGDYKREKIYSDDPVKMAKKWESQGADMIHIVDLDGAKSGKLVNLQFIKKIVKEIKIPVEVGGGIRDEVSARKLLETGVSKIVLGTVVFEDEVLFKKLLKKYQQQIIVSLDVKNGMLVSRGWIKDTGKKIIEEAKRLERMGVKSFIFTDIIKDGMLSKPNYKRIKILLKNVTVPVIASGGISSIGDIKKLDALNLYGAIIGKALYEGKIDLKEVLNVS